MPTTVSCPSCNRELRVPDNLQGQMVKCPACAHTFSALVEGAEEPLPPGPSTYAVHRDPEPALDEEQEVRPRKRRRIRYDEDDDYEEEEDYRRPRRRHIDDKPGKVQAIGIMMLIGGILGILTGVGLMFFGIGTMGICCLWPGTYYSLVMGILATIKGSALLGQDARREQLPTGIAIMQIINIINGDVANCAMGIISLVFLNEREVRRFFRA